MKWGRGMVMFLLWGEEGGDRDDKQCWRERDFVLLFKGGFGGNVRSCGGNGGRGGSIAKRGGGSLAKRSMESKDSLGVGGFVVLRGRSSSEDCLDGWVGAGGGEVKGGGVDFGVTRTFLGEIP
ncbi:hypothetical protein Tco_1319140 [Tanacetum coccineum]